MNNELFSFREPTISTTCCESHENSDEKIFSFDFLNSNTFKKPSVFDFLLVKSNIPENKQDHSVKKDTDGISKNNLIKKDDLHIVGDKKIQNAIKISDHPIFISPLSFGNNTDTNTLDLNVDNKLDFDKSNQVDKSDKIMTNSNKQKRKARLFSI